MDVIGRTVHLRRAGSGYMGLCPFHNEKTPSFSVSESRQLFHCFGCGAGGDVITFYERLYNLNFLEAAEKLAGEYGIEWSPGGGYDAESRKKVYYEINQAAARHYYQQIRVPGNPALAYMEGRGIELPAIKAFGIGYADDSGRGLTAALEQQGLSLEKAAEVGLVKKTDSGWRDMFYSRVMFPIVNTRGKVIAFGGRVLTGNPRFKYLNSPETPVFRKGESLYAVNLTKDAMVKSGMGILVEGYMDVVSLYQYGFANATAAMGTALTSSQARMLSRYAETVVLAYDADDAGVAAALKNMDIVQDAGLTGKVVMLGGAKDPDEYVQRFGKDAFAQAVAEAVPFMAFKFIQIAKELGLTAGAGGLTDADGAPAGGEQSLEYLKKAAAALSEASRRRRISPVETDYYIQKLARDTGISEAAIRREVEGDGVRVPGAGAPGRAGQASSKQTAGAGRNEALQKLFLRLMLHSGQIAAAGREYGRVFTSPALLRIYEEICVLCAETDGGEIDTGKLEEALEEPERAALAEILAQTKLAEDTDLQFRELCLRIEREELEARARELNELLGEKDVDASVKERIMAELRDLRGRINKIKEG